MKNQFPSGQYQPPLSIDVRGMGTAMPREGRLFLCGEPRGRSARPRGRLVVGRNRLAGRATLSSRTYIGKSGCPIRGRWTASRGSGSTSARGVDGRQRAQIARLDSWEITLARVPVISCSGLGQPREESHRGFRSGAKKVVSPATGDPGLTDGLPQVVPRSGRCHGDRGGGIHGPCLLLLREEKITPLPTTPIVGSILHDDSRLSATISDREKMAAPVPVDPLCDGRFVRIRFERSDVVPRRTTNVHVK